MTSNILSVGEKVRRERRWASAGETPARKLDRSNASLAAFEGRSLSTTTAVSNSYRTCSPESALTGLHAGHAFSLRTLLIKEIFKVITVAIGTSNIESEE